MSIPRWDESEPIVVALARWGLRDAFDVVIAENRREEAMLLLEHVGVDRIQAERIVASVLINGGNDGR